jgi:CheY-like chemotaxis protein
VNPYPLQDSCNVLLVESSDELGHLMAHILEEEGHSVVVVPSPDAAVALLEQLAFDLVITDSANRPEDAAESVAAIVSAAGTTPVLLCTGHPVELKELTQAGIDPFVRQPFDLEAFTERVGTLCGPAGSSVWSPDRST